MIKIWVEDGDTHLACPAVIEGNVISGIALRWQLMYMLQGCTPDGEEPPLVSVLTYKIKGYHHYIVRGVVIELEPGAKVPWVEFDNGWITGEVETDVLCSPGKPLPNPKIEAEYGSEMMKAELESVKNMPYPFWLPSQEENNG